MTPTQFNQIQTTLWKNRTPGIVEFNVILNQLPEAALVYDRERDVIVLANRLLLQLTAFTQDELSGNALKYLIPGAERQQLVSGEEKNLPVNRHNRNPIHTVVRSTIIDPDGQWFLLSIVPEHLHYRYQLKQQENLYQGFLANAELITCENLDEAFDKAMQIARTWFETSNACLYRFDRISLSAQKVISAGIAINFPEAINNIEPESLEKLSVWIPGRRVTTELHRTARIENLTYIASVVIGPDNEPYGLLVIGDRDASFEPQMSRMIDLLGKSITGAVQHFDVINKLKVENLSQSNRLAIQNSLVENSQEGILVISPGLTVDFINPAAELMLGYALKEIRNTPVENVLIGTEGLIPALEAACRGIETRDLGNVHLHHRFGHSFPAHIRTIAVQSEHELLAILVFISDKSEHEQIRIQTQQLEHRAILGDFTAVFAHDVRNPINNIVTGLQLLASKLSADDSNQDLINRMLGDSMRLNHLMDSVLSFSRPMEPRFESLDIANLLQKIMYRWQPRFARVNVVPFYQPAEDLPKIQGDPRLLEQVFTNLIGNAVEAMSSTGGTLGIHISLSDTIASRPQVRITVSDNGPGIPDELKDRVFEPFVTNNPRGTGLGLAITKRILTAHHGSVSLDTFPGGTMFHVYLPVGDGEEAWE